jgi:hypothetical protein
MYVNRPLTAHFGKILAIHNVIAEMVSKMAQQPSAL